ncbi:MAG: DUF402 domain-containing protein [Caldibacillus sp.]
MLGEARPFDTIEIQSVKHNGQIHRIWKRTTVLFRSNDLIIGANERTEVIEANGKVRKTTEPAICFFYSRYWFNIIGLIKEGEVFYYCNLSSPFSLDGRILKYIDYDLDILVYPDRSFQIIDQDEYEKNKKLMNYPEKVDLILKQHVEMLVEWIQQKRGPFAPSVIHQWYERFKDSV